MPTALAMRAHAYAPYSNFSVGAALLAEDGTVWTGCNVENASYGLSLCAERTAVAKAISEGRRTFAGLVVATGSERPSSPCGMCRQVLAEFAPDLPILLVNAEGDRVRTTARELLPLGFDRSFL